MKRPCPKATFSPACFSNISPAFCYTHASLQPPSPPRNPIIDISEPYPVNAYLDTLEQVIQLSDDPLDFLQRSQVTRVRTSKEQATKHEYILAEVSINSETYYFRSERTRGSQPRQTIEEVKASEDPELAEMGKMIEKLAHDAATPSESLSPLGTIVCPVLPGVPPPLPSPLLPVLPVHV